MNHSIFSSIGACTHYSIGQPRNLNLHSYKNAESSAATCREKTIHIINVPTVTLAMVKAKQLQFGKQC